MFWEQLHMSKGYLLSKTGLTMLLIKIEKEKKLVARVYV